MANDSKINTSSIIKLILDIYGIICPPNVFQAVEKNINNMKPNTIREQLKNNQFKMFITVPPFTKITFDNLKTAADHLHIPLDEKVYIPELGTWTKTAVPVGPIYIQCLEQFSEVYSNIRSVGKYQATGQATKGKAREGGQSLGNLDVNALLSYDANNVLAELLTLRSDDHKSKREVINNIITTGKANMPQNVGGGKTYGLMHIYLTGLGLNIE